ncbi:golgin subfamily A member 6-like protein 7 [Narcine bancroftii]|uniref:golgin subfamily A member 6-like protein 7 n=1 Tax=Narcine bancroftii TaxID=1343680 RepID=UPI003831E2EA
MHGGIGEVLPDVSECCLRLGGGRGKVVAWAIWWTLSENRNLTTLVKPTQMGRSYKPFTDSVGFEPQSRLLALSATAEVCAEDSDAVLGSSHWLQTPRSSGPAQDTRNENTPSPVIEKEATLQVGNHGGRAARGSAAKRFLQAVGDLRSGDLHGLQIDGIEDLEQTKQKLLDKINDLTSKSQQLTTNDLQLSGKLRCLQISERSLRNTLTEKERTEEMLKGKVCRVQNQLRMKEDEMNKQSEYFEHYKQRQLQLMAKLREREQCLQNQVFKLERERIDLNATSIVLQTELQQVTEKFTKLEKACTRRSKGHSEDNKDLANKGSCLLDGEKQLKEQILVLQDEVKNLLEKEEINNQEKEQLLERLQQTEDNENFLTRKLEDFRSRIHELKLSESSLQEQIEDLEEENEKLRREMKDWQEQENDLNVPEGEEPQDDSEEDKSKMNETLFQNCEFQFSSDEMLQEGVTPETKSYSFANITEDD